MLPENETRKRIEDYIKANYHDMPINIMAVNINSTKQTLKKYADSLGIKLIPHTRKDPQTSHIKHRINFIRKNPNLTISQMAVRLNVKFETIYNTVKRYNLKHAEPENRMKVKPDTFINKQDPELFTYGPHQYDRLFIG